MITTTTFWLGAAERSIKTFFQTFVAVVLAQLGADAIGATAGILDADWLTALSVAALATVLSLATSIGNADFTAGAVDPAHGRRADRDGVPDGRGTPDAGA